VKIVSLAPVSSCDRLVCHLIRGAGWNALICDNTNTTDIKQTHHSMDSPFPKHFPVRRSRKTVGLGESELSLSTTTSGHVDPMKPLLLLSVSNQPMQGLYCTTIESPLDNRCERCHRRLACNTPRCIQPRAQPPELHRRLHPLFAYACERIRRAPSDRNQHLFRSESSPEYIGGA
jgi:hypothetical protein